MPHPLLTTPQTFMFISFKKNLGVIMGCFILCWLPFFILALLKPLINETNSSLGEYIPKWLDSFLLWLGYFNSSLNPMIYAHFNREFRRPFIEILCFRCNNINERLRDMDRKRVQSDMNAQIKKKRSSIQTLLNKNIIGTANKAKQESVKSDQENKSKVIFIQKVILQ
jgi:hypothetical protein